MSQNDNQAGVYASLADLQQARRYALEAQSEVQRLHLVEDKPQDKWAEATAQLHHAVLQYYQQLRPYLLEHNIHHEFGEKPRERAKVFEQGDGKAFYVTQLDDWRLSETKEEREVEKVGEPDEVQEVTQPNILPPAVALECVDYLDLMLVKFGLTVEAEEPRTDEKRSVSEEPPQGGDNEQ